MDVFFQGHWRMDWGLGNPNKTAVLIAELLIASWGFSYWKRWGFWLSTVFSVVFGVCLIMTYSRGGLVAAICGVGILLAFNPRPWPKNRAIGVLAVFVLLGSFAFYSKALGRYGQGVGDEDPSIANRLTIWKMAPRMMVDAPSGWGWGRSGDAYVQWYQPVDRPERYRTLVNSHLTWLVEMGWVGRAGYFLAWIATLALCFPSPQMRWFAVPWGIWLTFGIGAFFSSVAESPWLWISPAAALISVLFFRLRRRDWPRGPVFLTGILVGAAVLGGIYIAGRLTPEAFQVHGSTDATTICKAGYSARRSDTPLWIISPDRAIIGEHYGHVIRKALAEGSVGLVGIATKGERLPQGLPLRVVLMGKPLEIVLPEKSPYLLLNPSGSPDPLRVFSKTQLQIFWGEFRQNEDRLIWETFAKTQGAPFIEIPGVAEYISNWLNLITGAE